MSLRTAVAAPFRAKGSDELGESEFVVALSIDRGWFTADQAKRLVDVAASEGLVALEDGTVSAQFDPGAIEVPAEFTPDESILQERTTLERALDEIVESGVEKQEAVAAMNRLQADLGVTAETAAVLVAHRRGLDTDGLAARALEGLAADGGAADGTTTDDGR